MLNVAGGILIATGILLLVVSGAVVFFVMMRGEASSKNNWNR